MTVNTYPGKLIVLEGLDGSGQTTQAQLLVKWFQDKRGQLAYYTKEPSDGPVGAILKLVLSHRLTSPTDKREHRPLDPATMALAFAADRADHLHHEIVPKLRDGVHVISDRYYLSSLAYQSIDLEYKWIREINQHALGPDLTFFFDVPPPICVKRMQSQRWHVELYEDLHMLEKVRRNYQECIRQLQLAGEKIEAVDGSQPVAEVHSIVVNRTKQLLRAFAAANDGTRSRVSEEQLALIMGTEPLTESEIASHQEG
ncbi:MAG: dTMP kinase [Gemmatimonadetes bacterium]|nr:dTMP kinase [Gemmatimonadota bacterium]